MLYILLAALLLLIAALLWRSQTAPSAARPAPPKPPALSEQTVDSLCAAVSALQALMGHPRLGGPGFLTLRLLPDGAAAAAAQYPNTLATYSCFLKLYFSNGQREKFFATIDDLKRSSVVIDRETLELIRVFQ